VAVFGRKEVKFDIASIEPEKRGSNFVFFCAFHHRQVYYSISVTPSWNSTGPLDCES